MIRFFARLLALGVLAYVVMVIALLAWTFTWPEPDANAMPKADVIVCLGAGMTITDRLGIGTQGRVERCVELYQAGVAPQVLFSGGVVRANGPSAARLMQLYAQELGLPEGGGVLEGASQSTLQNAILSLPLIAPDDEIILVTEAFHLPRSLVSFRWAAYELGRPQPEITLVMSEQVRPNRAGDGIAWAVVGRESLAIWFNLARASVYSGASLAGWAEERRLDWLH